MFLAITYCYNILLVMNTEIGAIAALFYLFFFVIFCIPSVDKLQFYCLNLMRHRIRPLTNQSGILMKTSN